MKRYKKIFHTSGNQKRAGVAMLTYIKQNRLKPKPITRTKIVII